MASSFLLSCDYFVPDFSSPKSSHTMEVLPRTGRRIITHDVSTFSLPSPNSSLENVTHNATKATSQEASGTLEIAPADDSVKPVGSSVSKGVISDKNKLVESSTDADSVQEKSDESEEKRRLEEAKDGNIPGSAAETSKEVKSVKESEVPECSEAKSLLPSGPPVVRTSWLSCCGLFDVMAGSER